MQTRGIIWIGMLALWMGACETVVDVQPPGHTPTLVVDGFFSADSSWAVRVSSSVPYTSSGVPNVVADAVVVVTDHVGRRLDLAQTQPGLYAATGLGAEAGGRYEVYVSAPGFAPTEGVSALPTPAHVAAFHQDVSSYSGLREVTMTLELDDPSAEHNYYGLVVLQQRWRLAPGGATATQLEPNLYSFTSADPVLDETALGVLDREERRYRDAFFSDERFNGQRRSIDLQVRYAPPDLQANVPVLRVFSVILISASEELYRYWTSADQQSLSGENPFAEPIRVFSNLSQGYGVFAGFQSEAFPVDAGLLSDVCGGLTASIPPCAQGNVATGHVVQDFFLGAPLRIGAD